MELAVFAIKLGIISSSELLEELRNLRTAAPFRARGARLINFCAGSRSGAGVRLDGWIAGRGTQGCSISHRERWLPSHADLERRLTRCGRRSSPGLSGPVPRAGRSGRVAGRPGVLRPLPGALLPAVGSPVDPDRDLPADDVPQAPLRAGLRDPVPQVKDSLSWSRSAGSRSAAGCRTPRPWRRSPSDRLRRSVVPLAGHVGWAAGPAAHVDRACCAAGRRARRWRWRVLRGRPRCEMAPVAVERAIVAGS